MHFLFHLLKFSLTSSTTSPKYLMVPLISTSQEICSLCMAPSENLCFFKVCFVFFLGLLLGGLCCFLVVVVVVVGLMHLLLRALIIMVKLELAMSVHKLNNY